MKVNMIGIGKMGYPLVQNMLDNNHEVYVYDVDETSVNKIKTEEKINGTTDFDVFIENALIDNERRIFFVMLPPGKITNKVLTNLTSKVNKNDVVIEGGNSNHKDSVYHSKKLNDKGAYFFDAGTSGGVEGARNGASFMIGGDAKEFKKVEPLFKSLSVENTI